MQAVSPRPDAKGASFVSMIIGWAWVWLGDGGWRARKVAHTPHETVDNSLSKEFILCTLCRLAIARGIFLVRALPSSDKSFRFAVA